MPMNPFLAGCALVDLHGVLAPIRAGGKDARDYLQRQVSADLRLLGPEQGLLSTLMTRKGKMVAAFDVHLAGGALLLIAERSVAEELASTLERLVILEDVTIERGDALGVLISLQGPAAERVLASCVAGVALPAAELGAATIEKGGSALRIVRRRRSDAGGFDLVVRAAEHGSWMDAATRAGAVRVDGAASEAARIDAGIPRFGVDADATHLPPESGYDRAISYSKGCFVGQEIVARLRTYGHVNQILRRVRLVEPVAPPARSAIRIGDSEVGRITSSAIAPTTGCGIALGYVRYQHAEPGTPVAVQIGDRSIPATLEDLGDF